MAGAQRRQSRINRTRVLHLDWRLGLIFAFANLILVARALRFVWNRVGRAEAAHIPRRSVSNMENKPGPQDTSESMWPVSGGAPREQRVPLTAADALRSDSQPAHDLHDRRVPLSIFQSVRSPSDPALLQSTPASVPDERERDAAGQDVGIALPLENSAIRFAPPRLPEWFWTGSSASPSETAQREALEEKAAETVETSAVVSRLSALRGAVAALGMKNLSRRKELPMTNRGESAEGSAQAVEAETIAVVPNEDPAGPVEEVRGQPAEVRRTLSITPEKAIIEPEPLRAPPKEFIPVKKRDAADEWEDGEVRILPARRGQYER